MKYFKLNFSSETNIIGSSFPQICKMKKGYNFDAENSIYKLSQLSQKDFDTFLPDLEYFVVGKQTKMTDLMSCAMLSNFSMIISPKFKEVLENFKLPNSAFYEIRIEYGLSKFENYFLFHFFELETEEIVFEKSEFEIIELFSKKHIGRIVNQTKAKYLILKEELFDRYENGETYKKIIPVNIKLLKKPEYDLFRLNTLFDGSIFISEQLHNELIKHNITGVEFQEVNYLLF